jgi:hypothetical protein
MKTKLIVFSSVLLAFASCTTKPKVEETQTKPTSVDSVANWDGCMLSAYVFQEDGRHLPANAAEIVSDFETLVEHELGSVMWYPTFADSFPAAECNALKEQNVIPHLTWELFFPDSVDYNTMPLEGTYELMDQVLDGQHDAYIEQFATDAKAFEEKLHVRFLHEFNGNWYLWGGRKNGAENGGPQKVVAVWKYVVNKFRAVGADNVKWVWNPHGPSIDITTDAWMPTTGTQKTLGGESDLIVILTTVFANSMMLVWNWVIIRS